MRCGVGCRHGSNLALLWLWHRPAARATIGPLACRGTSICLGSGPKKTKEKKRKKNRKRREIEGLFFFFTFFILKVGCWNLSWGPSSSHSLLTKQQNDLSAWTPHPVISHDLQIRDECGIPWNLRVILWPPSPAAGCSPLRGLGVGWGEERQGGVGSLERGLKCLCGPWQV